MKLVRINKFGCGYSAVVEKDGKFAQSRIFSKYNRLKEEFMWEFGVTIPNVSSLKFRKVNANCWVANNFEPVNF